MVGAGHAHAKASSHRYTHVHSAVDLRNPNPDGTGLIIFIKPQTSTQLVAGFAISIFFFIVHVQTNAYIAGQLKAVLPTLPSECDAETHLDPAADLEDELQFCAMLSITLTLFGGLGLKATTEIPTEKPTVYESGLMVSPLTAKFSPCASAYRPNSGFVPKAFILVGINVGVVLLSAYQIFLTFRKGPANSQTKLQRKVCVKIFDMALVKNQSAVVTSTPTTPTTPNSLRTEHKP